MTSMKRKLNQGRVQMAKRTELAKHELAMKMVAERVKTDAEFAADVLRVAGDGLREEIKKDALETIARANAKVIESLTPIGDVDGIPILGDRTHELVPVQTDGGGDILVEPTSLLDYPKDK